MAAAPLAVVAMVAGVVLGAVPAGAAPPLTTPGGSAGPVPAETAAASATAATIPTDTTTVRIAMTENNTLDVIVSSAGGVSAPGVANAPAVRFQRAAGETWNVQTALTCAGTEPGGAAPWSVQVGTGAKNPTASPVTASQFLTLCVAATQSTNDRGTLTATVNSTGAARTVNTLPLEEYVADTVPGESPSTWGSLGGPGPQGDDWGFQELESQAVAVRSYVLANLGGYGGYADTCDLSCQTYRGTKYETPLTVAAASDTAGQVMFMPNGSIATTEYSASTGGYTSGPGQTSPFTPVPDTGDGIATNPNHSWTATIPAASIQGAWSIGTFSHVGTVTTGPGKPPGQTFGRVNKITVYGSGGSKQVTGPEFADDLGLKSDFFHVTGTSSAGVSVTGHGWGHGIGMGQWGALGYAINQDNGQGNWTYQQIVTHYYGPATLGNLSGPPAVLGASGGVQGYWLSAADGGVFAFGGATFDGSMGGQPLNQPVVGLAATPDGGGYWEDASDGGIFSFGDAHFDGSMGGRPLNQPMVGMAATPDGGGYWEVASDGGIFSFGDAHFYGSMGGQPLNQPIVGMAATPDGGGYWLVAADGGIFAFGDATFFGSTGSLHLVKPVVGMAPAPGDGGYWLVAADGGIFAFGAATFHGSAAGTAGGNGVVGMAATPSGGGYLVTTAAGRVTAFGDAPQLGDLTTAVSNYTGHVVGIAATTS
jgi:SpoIID/LytB domain protein